VVDPLVLGELFPDGKVTLPLVSEECGTSRVGIVEDEATESNAVHVGHDARAHFPVDSLMGDKGGLAGAAPEGELQRRVGRNLGDYRELAD